MATAPEILRSVLRPLVERLATRDCQTDAVAILNETASHERLFPALLNADDELHQAIATAAAEWVRCVADDEMLPFEVGFSPSENQVLVLDAAGVSVLQNTRSLLEPPDPGSQFQLDEAKLTKLRGYSYSVKFADVGWVHFFRRLTRSSVELRRSNGVRAVFVNNRYELAPERGLRLDTDFDAVSIGGDLLIRSRRNFETLFDFVQLTVANAEATAAAVVSHLNIRGADDFIRVVSNDRRMHSKLQSAAERMNDPVYKAKVTDTSIADLVGKRLDIDLEVVRIGGLIELVFDGSAQRRWTLLKILDDDYLISELTESRYQAPSKHSDGV